MGPPVDFLVDCKPTPGLDYLGEGGDVRVLGRIRVLECLTHVPIKILVLVILNYIDSWCHQLSML